MSGGAGSGNFLLPIPHAAPPLKLPQNRHAAKLNEFKQQRCQYSVYWHLFQQQNFKRYPRDTVFTPFALESLLNMRAANLSNRYNTGIFVLVSHVICTLLSAVR